MSGCQAQVRSVGLSGAGRAQDGRRRAPERREGVVLVTPSANGKTTAASPTDRWPHARLIPTAGLRSDLERERRASSCLLAVMHGVPEFGHSLLKELGAPKSPVIETYAEVRSRSRQGRSSSPTARSPVGAGQSGGRVWSR